MTQRYPAGIHVPHHVRIKSEYQRKKFTTPDQIREVVDWVMVIESKRNKNLSRMNFLSFRAPSRPEAQWFPVGLTSSFPELDDGLLSLTEPRKCGTELKPGCRAFRVPATDPSQGAEVPVEAESDPAEESDSAEAAEARMDLRDQVLVFRYRGKIHAIDHVSNILPGLECAKLIVLVAMPALVVSALAWNALRH